MFTDALDNRILYVGRIGDIQLLCSLAGMQLDGLVVEDGEDDRSFIANDMNTVLTCRLMSHETPRPAARQTTLKLKTRTHRVFCLIQSATIGTDATGLGDDAEEILQQVQLMGGQVVEVAATRNIGLQTPRQVLLMGIVQLTGRCGKTDLYVDDLADDTLLYQFLHLQEIGQVATVVSHKTGHSRFLADTVDAGTVFIRCCQGFFHIHRLTGTHGHNGKGGMTRRRCGDIYGIHLGVVNQLLGIGKPTGNTMPLGITASTPFLTTHHRHDLRTFHLRKGGAALLLSHLTTTDEAPLQSLHIFFLRTKVRISEQNAKFLIFHF